MAPRKRPVEPAVADPSAPRPLIPLRPRDVARAALRAHTSGELQAQTDPSVGAGSYRLVNGARDAIGSALSDEDLNAIDVAYTARGMSGSNGRYVGVLIHDKMLDCDVFDAVQLRVIERTYDNWANAARREDDPRAVHRLELVFLENLRALEQNDAQT